MLTLAKSILGWKGFVSWQFWISAGFAVLFSWLVLTNVYLNGKVADEARERAYVETQLDDALDQNETLNKALVRLQIGELVDEQIVVSNQNEIDRIRREQNARLEEVRKQGSSGPASNAAICAITRVCDN